MGIRQISTENAPKAIGPYSQAIEANNTVYVSGQLAVDPSTGEIISGDIAAMTKRCLANVEAILKEAGLSLKDVVKTGVFLVDMNDFAAVNEAYAEVFGDTRPARSCVQVAALPKNAAIEIECIAIRPQ